MADRDEAVSGIEKGRLRSQLAIAGVLVIAAALRLWRLGRPATARNITRPVCAA